MTTETQKPLGWVTEGALKDQSEYAYGMFAYKQEEDTPIPIYAASPDLTAENARLREENFALSAGQCIHNDGTGLVGGEGGSPVCLKAQEVERLRQFFEFACSWAWRENPKLSDEERLSAIKYHPLVTQALNNGDQPK